MRPAARVAEGLSMIGSLFSFEQACVGLRIPAFEQACMERAIQRPTRPLTQHCRLPGFLLVLHEAAHCIKPGLQGAFLARPLLSPELMLIKCPKGLHVIVKHGKAVYHSGKSMPRCCRAFGGTVSASR